MKLRSLTLVVVLLALLSAGAWFLNRPSSAHNATASDSRVGHALAKADTLANAASVTLTDKGKTVVLDRAPDGDWSVRSYYDLPADFPKLNRLVQSLLDAKVERFVTRSPAKTERLGFAGSRIVIADAKGGTLWAADIGKDAEGGGRFIRFDGAPDAYLTRISLWLDAEAKSWANTSLLTLKPEEVQSLETDFPDGKTKVLVKRDKAGDAFTADSPPAGHTLQTSTVTSLLNTLTGLRFDDTAATDAADVLAAREHARTFKLTTFDHQTYTIALGRKPAPPAKETPKKESDTQANKTDDVKAKDAAASEQAEAPKTEEPAPKPGPVYVFISSDQAEAKINALMKKRAFEISEYTYTSLPENTDGFFTETKTPAPEAKK